MIYQVMQLFNRICFWWIGVIYMKVWMQKRFWFGELSFIRLDFLILGKYRDAIGLDRKLEVILFVFLRCVCVFKLEEWYVDFL